MSTQRMFFCINIFHITTAAIVVVGALLTAIIPESGAAAVSLENYKIDKEQITVSGLSSGAYFAVQLHVAYSASIKGAGVISGGPYYCAQGKMSEATTACMSLPALIDYDTIVSTTDSWAASGSIDDPSENIVSAPVFLFHGTNDDTVVEGVVDKLADFYDNYRADVSYIKHIPASHSFVTDNYGSGCQSFEKPYIVNCGYDGAGELLKKMYQEIGLDERSTEGLSGELVEFDQTAFYDGGRAHGIGSSGWLYVPTSCKSKDKACKLHVVFHGCLQSHKFIGEEVVRHTGYNEWAETNDMIIMYPQTGTGSTNGCWDWWGDNDSKQKYATKDGNQMAMVMRMISKVAGEIDDSGSGDGSGDGGHDDYDQCFHSNNYDHVKSGRAYQTFGVVYAVGSGQKMGLYNIFDYTKLRQTGASYYIIDTAC